MRVRTIMIFFMLKKQCENFIWHKRHTHVHTHLQPLRYRLSKTITVVGNFNDCHRHMLFWCWQNIHTDARDSNKSSDIEIFDFIVGCCNFYYFFSVIVFAAVIVRSTKRNGRNTRSNWIGLFLLMVCRSNRAVVSRAQSGE